MNISWKLFLLTEHRQRQGWKSVCFVTVYLPCSSAIRSWMQGLAGFRAARVPSCLQLPGQPPTHQGIQGAHEAAEQNRDNPFTFTSKPPTLTAAKLSTPISFTQQRSGILGSTPSFISKTLWYFNCTFWGRGTVFYPSLELSLVWDENWWIKIWFQGQLCQNQVNYCCLDTSWFPANYSAVFLEVTSLNQETHASVGLSYNPFPPSVFFLAGKRN